MFSKFERAATQGERGNAAVVALCVTTLAVGVVMGMRLLSGSGSSKPVVPIAATNIGAGESDADSSGTGRASSGPISPAALGGSSAVGSVGASSSGVAVSAPVPTLPGSVPTIPPDGAVPVAVPVPVVAVVATPTTAPPIILGLKTPQAASRNLFDAWKENDRARALRFATAAAVEVVFRQAWGAEVQDDGCSETSNPTSYHCAFVGDEIAWIVVVDQRMGPSGREFVPTRTIRTGTKNSSNFPYAPPTADEAAVALAAAGGSGGAAGVGGAGLSPASTIDPLLVGDAPLVDPAETLDVASPTIQDPSLLDPVSAAAALAEEASATSGSDLAAGGGSAGVGGSSASAGAGAKAPAAKAPKAAKKKKPTVRRPKSAVSSSSKSAVSTDAGGQAVVVETTKPAKKAAQPAAASSAGAAAEPATPAGGAVKAGAPPVNQVDG
jgi:hypothetical protein